MYSHASSSTIDSLWFYLTGRHHQSNSKPSKTATAWHTYIPATKSATRLGRPCWAPIIRSHCCNPLPPCFKLKSLPKPIHTCNNSESSTILMLLHTHKLAFCQPGGVSQGVSRASTVVLKGRLHAKIKTHNFRSITSLDGITNPESTLTIVFAIVAAHVTRLQALLCSAPSCVRLWSNVGVVYA